MGNRKRHTDNNTEKYLKYLSEGLSGKERHDFEKKIMQDKFEEEAFEGLTQLEAAQFNEDVAELTEKIEKRTASKKFIFTPFYKYAAAAVLILGTVSVIFLVRQSTESLNEIAMEKKLVMEEKTNDAAGPSAPSYLKEDTLKDNIAFVPETHQENIASERIVPEDDVTVKNEKKSIEISDITIPEVELKKEITPQHIETKDIDQALSGRAAGVHVSREGSGEVPVNGYHENMSEKPKRSVAKTRTDNIITVRGMVISSSDEEPLPGVNIIVRGTTTGTVSDLDGRFMLNVPADSATLQIASVGYTTEEVKVKDQQELTVALNEDLVALDEVVVVGYGTTRKMDVTGAISTVRTEDITHQPSAVEMPVIIEPKPESGWGNYREYIRENIDYKNLPGFEKNVTVKLNVTISASGKILNVVVERSEDHQFDTEAVRLVREGPAWLPGSRDGVNSEMEVVVRIKFEPGE